MFQSDLIQGGTPLTGMQGARPTDGIPVADGRVALTTRPFQNAESLKQEEAAFEALVDEIDRTAKDLIASDPMNAYRDRVGQMQADYFEFLKQFGFESDRFRDANLQLSDLIVQRSENLIENLKKIEQEYEALSRSPLHSPETKAALLTMVTQQPELFPLFYMSLQKQGLAERAGMSQAIHDAILRALELRTKAPNISAELMNLGTQLYMNMVSNARMLQNAATKAQIESLKMRLNSNTKLMQYKATLAQIAQRDEQQVNALIQKSIERAVESARGLGLSRPELVYSFLDNARAVLLNLMDPKYHALVPPTPMLVAAAVGGKDYLDRLLALQGAAMRGVNVAVGGAMKLHDNEFDELKLALAFATHDFNRWRDTLQILGEYNARYIESLLQQDVGAAIAAAKEFAGSVILSAARYHNLAGNDPRRKQQILQDYKTQGIPNALRAFFNQHDQHVLTTLHRPHTQEVITELIGTLGVLKRASGDRNLETITFMSGHDTVSITVDFSNIPKITEFKIKIGGEETVLYGRNTTPQESHHQAVASINERLQQQAGRAYRKLDQGGNPMEVIFENFATTASALFHRVFTGSNDWKGLDPRSAYLGGGTHNPVAERLRQRAASILDRAFTQAGYLMSRTDQAFRSYEAILDRLSKEMNEPLKQETLKHLTQYSRQLERTMEFLSRSAPLMLNSGQDPSPILAQMESINRAYNEVSAQIARLSAELGTSLPSTSGVPDEDASLFPQDATEPPSVGGVRHMPLSQLTPSQTQIVQPAQVSETIPLQNGGQFQYTLRTIGNSATTSFTQKAYLPENLYANTPNAYASAIRLHRNQGGIAKLMTDRNPEIVRTITQQLEHKFDFDIQPAAQQNLPMAWQSALMKGAISDVTLTSDNQRVATLTSQYETAHIASLPTTERNQTRETLRDALARRRVLRFVLDDALIVHNRPQWQYNQLPKVHTPNYRKEMVAQSEEGRVELFVVQGNNRYPIPIAVRLNLSASQATLAKEALQSVLQQIRATYGDHNVVLGWQVEESIQIYPHEDGRTQQSLAYTAQPALHITVQTSNGKETISIPLTTMIVGQTPDKKSAVYTGIALSELLGFIKDRAQMLTPTERSTLVTLARKVGAQQALTPKEKLDLFRLLNARSAPMLFIHLKP